MCLSPSRQGDSPIFADFVAKIGTVPVNGYAGAGRRSCGTWEMSMRNGWTRHAAAGALVVLVAATAPGAESPALSLEEAFLHPPGAARPWVYWFFMDGNLSREGITADLEAMRRAELGGAIIMEVNVGIPRGTVDFMSPQWRALFKHAVAEAERLGLAIALNAGPGWAGSGGPWIQPEQAMQHLVASALEVSGPKRFEGVLPRPQRRPAFFGDGRLPPALEKAKNEFYRDVAVLAFPTPAGNERIAHIDEKALYVRAPYSSQPGVKAFLPAPADHPAVPAGAAVESARVVDLTERLADGGGLAWDVPAGDWTILRFGRTSTGANTRPAPAPGLGLECDKFDKAALDAHFEAFLGTLLREIGPPNAPADAGWTSLHLDSWEMGAQNWTGAFRAEFQRRRGYDLLRYLPAMTGRVVDSREISERFLWDLRQTAQELVIENHAEHLKALGRRHGLGLSIEPYDMNPCADMSLGAVADVPMGEFWLHPFDTAFSVIEAASVAHTRGRNIVAAEAFTCDDTERWLEHPGSLKAYGDWALCAGVNRFVFHRYQHQPWLDRWPGMTMGPYGVHWERTQTWWEMVPAYHRYLARCQYLLRQGLPVADVCYLVAEGAPHVFRPSASATRGKWPDRLGYAFDGCAPETLLERVSVRDGRLVLPDGMSYRVLVLPERDTMTPALLRKVSELVAAGATVLGPPPRKSPSLRAFPQCDAEVQRLAQELWGDCDGRSITERRHGKGRVVWHRGPGDPLQRAKWIWHKEGNPAARAPVGKRFFRRTFAIEPPEGALVRAGVVMTADNAFELWVNGRLAGAGDNFTKTYTFDVTDLVHHFGWNVVAVAASNRGDAPNPAGLIGALVLTFRSSDRTPRTVTLVTDGKWQSAVAPGGDWSSRAAASEGWSLAMELGPAGMAPWHGVATEPEQYGPFEFVERVLGAMNVPPDFEADVPLRYIHRRDGPTDIYFVAHGGERSVAAMATFRVTGKPPELWDPITGRIGPAPEWRETDGRTVVRLALEPAGSVFVVFRKPSGAGDRKGPPDAPLAPVLDITGPWEVSFDPKWGGPERVTFEKLEDWSRRPEPGIRFYSGTATYRTTFDGARLARLGARRVVLDLGAVRELARVTLNGRELGVAWTRPYRVDATEAIRPGGNTLEVRVANLWPNRLIGDAGLPPEKRLAWTTWNPFRKDSSLIPSGLLGPVTVLAIAQRAP